MDMDYNMILEKANTMCKGTLMETLNIQYTEIGDDYVKATMPVNHKVHQPFGLLHGGATAALAESVGSMASQIFIDNKKFEARGIEINCNHLKSKKSGLVTAIAKRIHQGRTLHLWEIKVIDENENIISLCKLTNLIVNRSN